MSNFLNYDIPVRITRRTFGRRNYARRPKNRTLIPIPEHNAPTNKSNHLSGLLSQTKVFLPSLILSNVMSLAPKIDEVRYYAQDARLPRGVNSIILGTVYHPPNSNDTVMLEYLMDCLSSIESRYPNSGTILLGDFNKLKIARLKRSYNLKQIVNFPTRGPNTLDHILTNLKNTYEVPIKRLPFGLSDHFSVELHPKAKSELPPSRTKVKLRDLCPSKRSAFRFIS